MINCLDQALVSAGSRSGKHLELITEGCDSSGEALELVWTHYDYSALCRSNLPFSLINNSQYYWQ